MPGQHYRLDVKEQHLIERISASFTFPAPAGVSLTPGSGTWSSLSDRNAKENFTTANGWEILERAAALPLASWNYKAQGAGVRHLGPTAQDSHAAFGLGEGDRTITTINADAWPGGDSGLESKAGGAVKGEGRAH